MTVGDVRFERSYERVRDATDRVAVLRSLTDEEVVAALAAASRARDPLLANVLATEAHNRILRSEKIVGLLSAAPDAMLVVDEEHMIRFANLQAERLYGGALVGTDVFELLPERHRAWAVQEWARFVSDPDAVMGTPRQDLMAQRRDGTQFPAEITMNPLSTDTGRVVVMSVRPAAVMAPTRRFLPTPATRRALLLAVRVGALSGLLIGGLALSSWILDDPALRIAWMAPATAAGVAVASIALWMLGSTRSDSRGRRAGVIACGATVALLGALMLAELFVGSPDIDRLLMLRTIPSLGPSPLTAAALVLLGAALALSDRDARALRRTGQLCATAAMLVALLALSGYLGAIAFHGWPPIVASSAMPVATALVTLALAAGILAARPAGLVEAMARASSGGTLLRRVLPFALLLPLAIGAVVAVGLNRGAYDIETGFAIFAVCVIAALTFALDRSAITIDREEADRHRAEVLFRGLLYSAPEAMLVIDKEGAIRYVNDQAGRVFGYTVGELIGRPLETLLPERAHDLHAANRDAYAARPRARPMGAGQEIMARRSNGEEFPVAVNLAPIETDEGLLVAATIHDITQRKRAESDLRQMSALVEQSDDLVVVTDRMGKIEYVNPSFEQKTGYTREEAVGQTPRILRSGEQDAAFYAQLWTAILSGRVFRGRLVNRRKNGELYVEEKTITPLRDAKGQITHFVSSGKDITAVRRAEESRGRLAAIVESAPDGIMGKSLEGVITSWNAGCERIFGYTAEEAIGRPMALILPPGFDEAERKILARAASGEAQSYDEVQRVRKDGAKVWATLTVAPVRDERGNVIGLASIYHDVTARKKTQERLDHVSRLYRIIAAASEATIRATSAEDLLRSVCEIMAARDGMDMVWGGLIDETETLRPIASAGRVGSYLDGLTIHVGPGALEGPIKHAVDTAEPAVCADIAHDPAMAPWRERALKNGFASSAAVPITADGRVVGTLNVYSGEVGFFDPEETRLLVELAGNVGLAIESMNIKRERDRVEAQLRQSHDALETRVAERTRELREAYADLEAFSATVSHDLRAPLRGIETFTRILEEEHAGQLDAEGRDSLARIGGETKRMRRLIDDLLSYSRASQSAFFPEPIDVTTMAEEIAAGLRARDPARAVEVSIDRGLVAQADPKLLHIALENLLGNAWKFTSKREEARIHVGATLGATGPTFFVADNGAGFDASKAATLFQPFRRLHAGEFEGTGLGLATVRRIVERHGGSVWAEGRVGEGATIWFSLAPTTPAKPTRLGTAARVAR